MLLGNGVGLCSLDYLGVMYGGGSGYHAPLTWRWLDQAQNDVMRGLNREAESGMVQVDDDEERTTERCRVNFHKISYGMMQELLTERCRLMYMWLCLWSCCGVHHESDVSR